MLLLLLLSSGWAPLQGRAQLWLQPLPPRELWQHIPLRQEAGLTMTTTTRQRGQIRCCRVLQLRWLGRGRRKAQVLQGRGRRRQRVSWLGSD